MPSKRTSPSPSPAGKSAKSETDSAAVDRFLATLTHPLKAEIEALRRLFLSADARIQEGIKWNAPSFHCGDWFATFDLRSEKWVQIILHRGAKAKSATGSRYVPDPDAILKWITDDRCVARFVSKADVAAKSAAFSRIVADWTRKLSKESEAA